MSIAGTLPAFSDLTLREKIAQLICVRIGSNVPPVRTAEQDEERIARLLDQCCVGGLALFNGGTMTREVLDRLQARAKVPLLIGADIERGVGQQVKGYTLFPHLMAFSKMPESEGEAAVSEFARTVAAEAAHAGIHVVFGPVADVSTNPSNPIIATRAFSDDPQRAAKLVSEFVSQLQANGVFATAKHFPGHGDTDLDSHDTLPVVTKTRPQLEACELLPFRAAVKTDCALIMTAHIGFPAIDATGVPATFSAPLLGALLRDDLGYNGVICSDSLLMAGARDRFDSEGTMAHAALSAGVDWLLDLDDPIAVVDDLYKCVQRGTLSVERIDESLARIWRLKSALRSEPQQSLATNSAAKSVAGKAIRVLGTPAPSALPLSAEKPLAAFFLKPFETPIDPPEQPIAAALRERFSDLQYIQLGPRSDAATYSAAHDAARRSPQILVAMVVRPAAWQVFGLLAEQKSFVRRLLLERHDVTLVSLGVPSALDDFSGAAARICTYSDVPVSQVAVVEFLLSSQGSIACK